MATDSDSSFHALLFQWSARASVIAFEMVIPVIVGVLIDKLLGTVVLFAIIGVILGMVLGFWQLLKIAQKEPIAEQNAPIGHAEVDTENKIDGQDICSS